MARGAAFPAGLPAAVVSVVGEVARFLNVEPEQLFVADHNHECLREGAFSIGHEGGDSDWPLLFTEAVYRGDYSTPAGVLLESVNGSCLAIYPGYPG